MGTHSKKYKVLAMKPPLYGPCIGCGKFFELFQFLRLASQNPRLPPTNLTFSTLRKSRLQFIKNKPFVREIYLHIGKVDDIL